MKESAPTKLNMPSTIHNTEAKSKKGKKASKKKIPAVQ